MTDAELKELVASLALAQRETDRQIKELDLRLSQRIEEADHRLSQRIEETDHRLSRQIEATDRRLSKQISELGKQIGGLGEKFGSFTEGLALPSMRKLLRERFGMEVVSPSLEARKDGRHLEIDVFAYANGTLNRGYVVEVKSHVREEAIEQMKNILAEFRAFFPEHRDKTLYGILAAVHIGARMREKVLRAGFYVAEIHDHVFALDVPEGFEPKAY
jgi:hypothetical protein